MVMGIIPQLIRVNHDNDPSWSQYIGHFKYILSCELKAFKFVQILQLTLDNLSNLFWADADITV